MENLRPRDLLFITMESLGAAYQAAQMAKGDIDVMEIFPLGPKGHLVFFAEEPLHNFTDEIQKEFASKILNLKRIEKCSAHVLKSYFSVENAPLEQSLLVLESSFIGDLVAVANEAVSKDLRIVDLRLQRGSIASATLFLTGSDEATQVFADKVKDLPVKTSRISKPSAKIRDFFAIQP